MSDGGTMIHMPNGECLHFYEEEHSYWRHNKQTGKRGRRLTGVTTAVKPLDYDNQGLLDWAARMTLIGTARVLIETPDFLAGLAENAEPKEQSKALFAQLEELGLSHNDVRDQAGAEGTKVHKHAFEALAAGQPMPVTDGMSERERGLSKAVHSFWFDHSPVFSHVEQIVYSSRLGVAGRLDGIGELTVQCDNESCACHLPEIEDEGVVDLKTGNYIGATAHAQVGGGYPLLARESGFDPGKWALILKVNEDGTYELIKAEGSPNGFEASVLAYREAGRINGAHRKASQARKELVTS